MVEQQNSSLLTCAAASRDEGYFVIIKPVNFLIHLPNSLVCLMQFRGELHRHPSSHHKEDYSDIIGGKYTIKHYKGNIYVDLQ